MDIVQAAGYFDRQYFDAYDFSTESWELNVFTGQLKRADDFVSIWNRPTRKRMLYTAKDVVIPSTVIRLPTTQEIYMVGHGFGDSFSNVHYRTTTGLHQAAATMQVYRKTPVEVLGVKGWATNTLVKTTFGDLELRSVGEGQEASLYNYGSFFLFSPSDSQIARHDTVVLEGTTYYVFEVYVDSGFRCARVSSQPDERVNFTYTSVGSQVYNPATQTTSSTDTTYNTTGKIKPLIVQDLKNSDVVRDRVQVMIIDTFISYTPKIGDKIAYLGTTYTVEIVQRDAGLEEWILMASL